MPPRKAADDVKAASRKQSKVENKAARKAAPKFKVTRKKRSR